jgi:hypothetical protein
MLVGTGPNTEPDDEGAAPPGWRKVDGRQEPHRLPQSLIWEVSFRTLLILAGDGQGGYSDDKIAALSKYTLYISPSDIRQVVNVAESTLRRVDEIRRPLNEEHGSGKSLGWTLDRRVRTHEAAGAEVLKGKRKLQERLSRRSFRALERWLTEVSFGTVGYVRE